MKHVQRAACGILLLIVAAICFVGGASGLANVLEAVHHQSETVTVFSGSLPMLFISPVIGLIGLACFMRQSPRNERWVGMLFPWALGIFVVTVLSSMFVPMQWYVAQHGYERCPKLAFTGVRSFSAVWYKDDSSSCAPSLPS